MVKHALIKNASHAYPMLETKMFTSGEQKTKRNSTEESRKSVRFPKRQNERKKLRKSTSLSLDANNISTRHYVCLISLSVCSLALKLYFKSVLSLTPSTSLGVVIDTPARPKTDM